MSEKMATNSAEILLDHWFSSAIRVCPIITILTIIVKVTLREFKDIKDVEENVYLTDVSPNE